MNFVSSALSNENRNPVTSSPSRIYTSESSPLSSSKSRSNRTPLIKPSIRENSQSPTPSPTKRLSSDLKFIATDSTPDENAWEQGLDKIGKYISFVQNTFKKETDSKKDAIDRLHKDLASFRYKCQNLETTLHEKNDHISQLESTNEQYHSTLTNSQKQLQNALLQISEYQKREEEFNLTRQELDSVQSALKSTTATLATKEDELEKWKARSLQNEKEKEESNAKVESLTLKYASLEQLHSSKIENLSKELELSKHDNTSLEQKLSLIRDKANILMKDYEENQIALQSTQEKLNKVELSYQNALKEHEHTILIIQNEKEEIMSELHRSLGVLEKAQSEAKIAAAEIADREKKNFELHSQITRLNDDVSCLTSILGEEKKKSQEYLALSETLKINLKEKDKLKIMLENELATAVKEKSSLALELRDFEKQIENLHSEIDDSNKKSRDLESRIRHLMDDNEMLDSDYNKQIGDLESQKNILTSQLDNLKMDNSHLHNQVLELQEQKGSLQKELHSATQKYSHLDTEHSNAIKSLNELKVALESLTNKQKELEASLHLHQQELSVKQALLSRAENKCEFQETELDSIRQEKVQFEVKFYAAERKINDLQSKLHEFTSSYDVTQSTLEKVYSDLDSKVAELENAQNDVAKLKKELSKAQDNLTELETLKKEQKNYSVNYENEILELKKRLEFEATEHEEKVSTLQISLASQLAITKHLNSEKSQLDSKLLSLQNKCAQLEENYENLVDQNTKQARSYQTLEQNYSSLEEQFNHIRARNSVLELKQSEFNKHLENTEQILKQKYSREKEELEIKLKAASKDKDNLMAEKAKHQIFNKEKMEILEKEKKDLQEKLTKNEMTLNELQSQLNNKAIQLHRYHCQSTEAKKNHDLELERQKQQNKSLQQSLAIVTKKLNYFEDLANSQSNEPTEDYEVSQNADLELARKYERLKTRYSNLEAELLELKDLTLQLDENILSKRCRALEEELSTLRIEHDNLLKQNRQMTAKLDSQHDLLLQNSDLSMQVAMLDEVNTSLMGHQNQNQKIRYLVRLKEECSRLKEQLSSATKERDLNRLRIGELEDELNALRPVEHTSGKKRFRMEYCSIPNNA